jgi:hypothetical protein
MPETVVTELIEHHAPINYPKGRFDDFRAGGTDRPDLLGVEWVGRYPLSGAARRPDTDEIVGCGKHIRIRGGFRL